MPTLADLKGYARAGRSRSSRRRCGRSSPSTDGKIVPSQYAKDAKAANLDIITWTLERSGRIVEEVLPTKGTARPSFYYQTTLDALTNDGDIMVDARRAGQAGRHPRHLLRLGRDGDATTPTAWA